jgi:osmotically-inducible protein OsmY
MNKKTGEEVMKKQIVRYLFVVLSVFVCVIVTYTRAHTQATNTSPNPTETRDAGTLPDSNTKPSGSDTKIATQGTVRSGTHDQAMTENDRGLNSRIREAFNRDSVLRDASGSVFLNSANGNVTLNGTVATEKEKKDLETELQRVTGVNSVRNELQIAPRPKSSNSSPTPSR